MSHGPEFPRLKRGIVAILRGLRPDEAVAMAQAIHAAGIEAVEVPLNSPEPFVSIAAIVRALPDTALIGAGTVLDSAQVAALHQAGGRLVVSPNVDAEVLAAAAGHGMVTMPGVFTPTEAFAAIRHGASALKFFPASVLGAGGIAAIRAVLPAGMPIGAVGGVAPPDFATYHGVGVRLFGLGTSLFKPGMTVAEVARRAGDAVDAWDALDHRD